MEQPDPGRRQLYGQGQPVEPDADLGHGGRVLVADREAGFSSLRPLYKEADRLVLGEKFQSRRTPGVGQRKRRRRVLEFSVDSQQGAAGHEDLEAGAGREKVSDQRGGLNHLLEVIEQEEHLPVAQITLEALKERLLCALHDAERPGDGGGDEIGVRYGGQLDEEYAALELVHELRSRLQSEARLACSSRTRERQQPNL